MFHPIVNLRLEKNQCFVNLVVRYLPIRYPTIDCLFDGVGWDIGT